MSRTRATLTVAAVLATAFTLAPSLAAAGDGCQGRVLNVVAHHDDDLLFLSPDLIKDIKAEKCVQTLFLVASDYPNNRTGITDDEYMKKRELGVRDAYARAAGVDETKWSPAPHGSGKATQWTLNEKISVVELRISDASTEPQNRLWRLYALDQPVTTRRGDRNVAQTFNRTGLGDFLRDVVHRFQPDEIKTGDPLADHRSNTTHSDHLATARLVRWALEDRGTPVTAYRDYSISAEPENLSESDAAAKTDIFREYVKHDQDICRTTECLPEEWVNPAYREWMKRQYPVTPGWRGGFVEPLPKPYADNPRPGPRVQGHYKIRNVGTGHELAIFDASEEDQAALITWTPETSANQKFELRATLGGWEIAPLHVSGKCLDLPESSLTRGHHVTQFRCTGNANQSLRVIGHDDGSYELAFTHSGLRLTAPANAGDPVTQHLADGGDAQRWRFEAV